MKFKNLKLNNSNIEFLFESLKTDGMVRILGLGVFTIRKMKSRTFFHDFSKKTITTKAHNKLHFRPFTKTKQRCSNF